MYYHAEFGRSKSNRVRISRGESPKMGPAGVTPPCDWLSKNKPSNMCYPAEFGRSTFKGVKKGTAKIEKRWGSIPWNGRRGWPHETRPSSHVLPCRGRFGWNVRNGVGINRGESPKLGSDGAPPPWDERRGRTQEIGPSLKCVTLPSVVVLRENKA